VDTKHRPEWQDFREEDQERLHDAHISLVDHDGPAIIELTWGKSTWEINLETMTQMNVKSKTVRPITCQAIEPFDPSYHNAGPARRSVTPAWSEGTVPVTTPVYAVKACGAPCKFWKCVQDKEKPGSKSYHCGRPCRKRHDHHDWCDCLDHQEPLDLGDFASGKDASLLQAPPPPLRDAPGGEAAWREVADRGHERPVSGTLPTATASIQDFVSVVRDKRPTRTPSRSPTPSAGDLSDQWFRESRGDDPWLNDDPWTRGRRAAADWNYNADWHGIHSENGWYYSHHNKQWTPPPPSPATPATIPHFTEPPRGPEMYGSRRFEAETRMETSGPAWPAADPPREGRSRSPTHSPPPSPTDETWGAWTGDAPAAGSNDPAPPQQQRRRGNFDQIPRNDDPVDANTGGNWDPKLWRQSPAGNWYPRRQPNEQRRGRPSNLAKRALRDQNNREEPRESSGSGW
jgi:hypothetical protein